MANAKKEVLKKGKFKVLEAEDTCFIVEVGPNKWKMRVRFDLTEKEKKSFKLLNKDSYKGRIIEVQYNGSLERPDVETPLFVPYKIK